MSRLRPQRAVVRLVKCHGTRLLALALAVSLSGCGSAALGRSFNDYSAMVAEASNRQLLLNLARTANAHPPHILQLGLINTTFQFGTNAQGTWGYTRTGGRAAAGGAGPFQLLSRVLSWGANLGANVSEQPTFGFTPLSGPQFAQGFLSAVPPTVFFSLLDQGAPVDQLMRILVHSVDFTDPGTGKTVTLANAPRFDDKSYIDFLRLAGIAVELQRCQMLRVATTPSVTQAAPAFSAPTIEDTLKAAEKGFMLQEVEKGTGKYALTSVSTATTLQISPEGAKLIAHLQERRQFKIQSLAPPGPQAPAPPPSAPWKDRCTPPDAAAPAFAKPPAPKGVMTLKLRSFFVILSFVSIEQKRFDAFAAQPDFLDSIPPSQHQPVLRLTWEGVKGELEPPLVVLQYGDQTYAVTDVRGARWNRDTFTLLSYIASQVSLDPKSLPAQQLIQVQ